MDFAVLVNHRVKIKEIEKRDKYLDLARVLKKLWNMKVIMTPAVNGVLGTIPKGAGRVGNRRTNQDHPNYSIVKIGQNTEKNPGE